MKGLQARNLETRLNDKLAASGRTVTPGDIYAVTVRRGKYQDGVPYQAGQEIQPAGDGSVTHILEALGVSAGGETINFKRVTDAELRKMESGAKEGENVAEVAGDGEGDVEYSTTDSTKAIPQDISRFNFNKYLRDLIGPPPEGMVDPHAHHIVFKKGNGQKQKGLSRRGHALLRRFGIDPIFGKENLVWAPNRVAGQHKLDTLEFNVKKLEDVESEGGSYDDIVDMLSELGEIASTRR